MQQILLMQSMKEDSNCMLPAQRARQDNLFNQFSVGNGIYCAIGLFDSEEQTSLYSYDMALKSSAM